MTPIDHSILTLILLVPLAGAVIVELLPDRGKLPNWIALLTTLGTFALTLHLPTHFVADQGGFQFEINRLWITDPAISYHVGVDGLSLWLVVLTGLLAPIGVLASWNAIQTRRKVFYSLFLVQQTAMFGVFIALDLMLYYGFWELSLVPMAILIAMYGRKEGPKAALKFFLFTFIPSAPLLVAILWLYARMHTFDFVTLQVLLNHSVFPARAMFWVALAFLFAFAVAWYVTKMFWEGTPPAKRIFVANPEQGSRHNRGCAVDLTLYDLKTGEPIRMTGGYDEMSERSYPFYPGGTARERWHRDLLRRAMEAEGFTVYEEEWWHFDYKDWKQYPIMNLTFEQLENPRQ